MNSLVLVILLVVVLLAVLPTWPYSTGFCNGASGVKPVLRCLATGFWLLSVVGAAAAHKMLSEGAGEPI